MNKVTTAPSSAVWSFGGKWKAHITIYTDEARSQEVHLEREFDMDFKAFYWRSMIVGQLQDFSIAIEPDSTVLQQRIDELEIQAEDAHWIAMQAALGDNF